MDGGHSALYWPGHVHGHPSVAPVGVDAQPRREPSINRTLREAQAPPINDLYAINRTGRAGGRQRHTHAITITTGPALRGPF